MANNNEIVINVKNTVDVTNSNSPANSVSSNSANGHASNESGNGINGKFIASQSISAVNAVAGDTEVGKMISQAGAIGIKSYSISQALAKGNYASLIALTISLALEAIAQARAVAQEQAAIQNSIDEARMAAGIMDTSNVKITTNWWSKRYEYERR